MTYAAWLARQGLTAQKIARIVAWTEKWWPKYAADMSMKGNVVASLVARLSSPK